MRARGVSLIEVVASLVLLATTVTLLLTAQARSLEQLRTTRDRQIAANLAHELITVWKIDPETRSWATEGHFVKHPNWHWTRVTAPYPFVHRSPLQEVTVTIYRTNEQGVDRPVSTHVWLERPDEL